MNELSDTDCAQIAGGIWIQPLEGEALAGCLQELVDSLWQPATDTTVEWT